MWRKFIINSQIFSSCWRTIVEDKVGTGPLLVWSVNRVDKWKKWWSISTDKLFLCPSVPNKEGFQNSTAPAKRMESVPYHELTESAVLSWKPSWAGRLILNILLFYGPPFDVSTRQVSTSPDLQVFVPVYDKISPNKIRPRPSLLQTMVSASSDAGGWHQPHSPALMPRDVFIGVLFCHDCCIFQGELEAERNV